jgi:hypothetical protein
MVLDFWHGSRKQAILLLATILPSLKPKHKLHFTAAYLNCNPNIIRKRSSSLAHIKFSCSEVMWVLLHKNKIPKQNCGNKNVPPLDSAVWTPYEPTFLPKKEARSSSKDQQPIFLPQVFLAAHIQYHYRCYFAFVKKICLGTRSIRRIQSQSFVISPCL